MLSLISETTALIVSIFVWVLKSVVQVILFYLKMLWKLLRLFISILPVTGVVFTVFFLIYAVVAFAGFNPIPPTIQVKPDVEAVAQITDALRIWWHSVYMQNQSGALSYAFIVISAILFIPVTFTVIAFLALTMSIQYLFFALLIDIVWYILCSLFLHELPSAQIAGRFYTLFPKAATRHYEKNYERWLRRHHDEFEDDNDYDDEDEYYSRSRRRRRNSFYDEDEYDDEDADYEEDDYYEDEYLEDDEGYYDYLEEDEGYEEDYPDRRYRDEYYEEDEDIDEEDEDSYYQEQKSSKKQNSGASSNIRSFDFFAGCKSVESLDKKYKTLVKLYHPDNSDGDTSALQEINVQYTEAKKKLKSS